MQRELHSWLLERLSSFKSLIHNEINKANILRKMKKTLLTTLAIMCAALCAAQKVDRRARYVSLYKDCAIHEMNTAGIPASITLAQGILESDCGDSELAQKANNHFGIKCHGSLWNGKTYHHDDDRADECFRVYPSVAESFADHTEFLTSRPRYASLFELERTDYKGWANGLKKAGYATDPNYAKRLITIIEEMGLHQYDLAASGEQVAAQKSEKDNKSEAKPVGTKPVDSPKPTETKPRIKADAQFAISPLRTHKVEYNNGVRYIETSHGDSFKEIAREFHLLTSELLKYNDLDTNASIDGMRYIYIRSKRNRAHPDCPTHTVQKGETPWSVAHKYGIKLRKLCRYNHISPQAKLDDGQVLNLRKSK